jgi:hypothetical protein
MYYTATAEGGRNNKIGAAFSNDGIHWVKYGAPLIVPEVDNPLKYGSGRQQVRNINGKSRIQMWYTDDSSGTQKLYERTSSDGVNFGAPRLISANGLWARGLNRSYYTVGGPGIALSPYPPYYLYGLFGRYENEHNRTGRHLPGKQMKLYKIPYDQRYTGKWQLVDTLAAEDVFSSPLLSEYENSIFEGGFRTDVFGNIFSRGWPEIWTAFGCGAGYGAKRKVATWDLCQAGGR